MGKINPEYVQVSGALLAFVPQALVVKDLVKDLSFIPELIIPLGYFLLSIGFIWEIYVKVRGGD